MLTMQRGGRGGPGGGGLDRQGLDRAKPCATIHLQAKWKWHDRTGQCGVQRPRFHRAEVAELADAHGSGPCTRKGVGVRVPSSAPTEIYPSCNEQLAGGIFHLARFYLKTRYLIGLANPAQSVVRRLDLPIVGRVFKEVEPDRDLRSAAHTRTPRGWRDPRSPSASSHHRGWAGGRRRSRRA